MSVYFHASGTSIWNPASDVGVLFAEQLEAAARFANMETGMSPLLADSFVVDSAKLAALARALLGAYEGNDHGVLRLQLQAVLAPLLVLVDRTDAGAIATTDSVLRAEMASAELAMPT